MNGLDNQSSNGSALRELALFAGTGGGILGGHLLCWRTVCAVEWEPYPASVLVARQNEGILPPFPIWDDVQTFDGRPWRGIVDVVSGGFPCQDISVAGKGAGIDGERSGMWRHMARIIDEVRPRFAFVENSPALIRRGLARVIGDLAEIGYDCRWCVMGADDIGAPHRRKRIWVLAYPVSTGERWQSRESEIKADAVAYTNRSSDRRDPGSFSKKNGEICERHEGCKLDNAGEKSKVLAYTISERQPRPGEHWFSSDPAEKRERETDYADSERLDRIWGIKSRLGRVAHGVANRVDRLKAIGNGQVPAVAAAAFRYLSAALALCYRAQKDQNATGGGNTRNCDTLQAEVILYQRFETCTAALPGEPKQCLCKVYRICDRAPVDN